MLAIISPAKSLDFEQNVNIKNYTNPEFLRDSEKLINKLKKLSVKKIGDLMSISRDLSQLNYARYNTWELPFTEENAKPAIFAFKGDVYRGLDIESYSDSDIQFAQDHLLILSGLYGLLRPLDLIQPYRLEMGTKLSVGRKKNLYAFWENHITSSINEKLVSNGDKTLLNLASNEYFKAVVPKKLNGRIVHAQFKDMKNGEYKAIMTFAKLARGMMTSYIMKNKINNVEDIKGFDTEGYAYNARLSTENEWIFTRG